MSPCRELKLVLCDNLEWWDGVGGRREVQEGGDIYIYIHLWLIHGEGNGNPLQYSCLENPRDGGAWWAAIYGVAQSRT